MTSNALPAPLLLIPDGWVLVPAEPTEEMNVAGCNHDDPIGGLVDWRGEGCVTRETVAGVYKAMIAASSPPPIAAPSLNLPESIELALDHFWNIAYQQGKEGRQHDDKAGSAQTAEQAVREAIAAALHAWQQRS